MQRAATAFFGLLAVIALVALLMFLGSCAASRPAAYGAELAACTETSSTLEQSQACEDRVRSAYGRPPRDAGKEDAK